MFFYATNKPKRFTSNKKKRFGSQHNAFDSKKRTFVQNNLVVFDAIPD